jgi:DNA repair protein RecO (recombination protein O)
MVTIYSGIVLNQIKYSDSQIITRVFSPELGSKSYLLRSRKSGKGVNRSIIQPLSLISFSCALQESKGLQTIQEVQLARPYTHIPFDPIKSSITLFLQELMHKCLPEDYVNDQLYTFLKNALILLDDAWDARNFHVWSMLEISRHFGFYPLTTPAMASLYFNVEDGLFSETPSPNSLDLHTSGILADLLHRDWSEVQSMDLHSSTRRMLLHGLSNFLRYHLDGLREIKSIEILQEVFHTEG